MINIISQLLEKFWNRLQHPLPPIVKRLVIAISLIILLGIIVFSGFGALWAMLIAVTTDPVLTGTATLLGFLLAWLSLRPKQPSTVRPQTLPYTSHLFITYAPADKAWATPLVEYLTAKFTPTTLWTDDSGLAIDSPQFQEKLQHTATFLVVWSDDYCDSKRCSAQFNHLLNHVKAEDRGRLFVVEREYQQRPKELEHLNRYHFGNIDLTNLQENDFPKLTQLIDGMTSKLQDLGMIPPPPPLPVSVPVPVVKKPSPQVLVNAYKGDELLTAKIINILDKHQFKGFGLTYQGTAKKIREHRDRMMQDSHAMVVVYGNTDNLWVQSQCADFAAKHSPSEVPIAICETPNEMPVLIAGRKKFGCHDPSLENQVCDFLTQVKSHAI
jgi:hypothetical protein